MYGMSDGFFYILLAGLMFALAVGALVWPGRGFLARWRRRIDAHRQTLAEDALKHLHAAAWQGRTASLESVAGALHLTPHASLRLVRQLEAKGWVASHGSGLLLTLEGEHLALEVIRAHRLWERYSGRRSRDATPGYPRRG